MDCINILPDEVLVHILSFLTTKEAALTSVLSKRWRNLIAYVPNLDIENYGIEKSDDTLQLFIDFVDKVLALQGSSLIEKFSLRCAGVHPDRVDAWISNVLVRGVLELDLSVDFFTHSRHTYQLSPKCFQNKKLFKLVIGRGLDIGCLDECILLPMLKSLVLDNIRLSVEKFEFLLQALPALEELVIAYVSWQIWDSANVIFVSSASLKTLKIEFCSSYRDIVSFDTPSLVYFSYSDSVAEDYPLVKMENLFEARISLLVTDGEIKLARAQNNDWLEDEENVVLRFTNVGKLMNGIRNVKYLTLSSNTLEVLSLCCESMPVFKNLKSLRIKSDKGRGWQAMPVLLRNCPRLETLVLKGLLHHVIDKCGDACACVSREDKGHSLTSCPVKVLEIQKFQGTMEEMHLIKHFLDYFPCLKEMKIHMEGTGPTQIRVPEVSKVIAEMMEHYNKSSSCNVHLLLSGYLYKKWTCTIKSLKNKTCSKF